MLAAHLAVRHVAKEVDARDVARSVVVGNVVNNLRRNEDSLRNVQQILEAAPAESVFWQRQEAIQVVGHGDGLAGCGNQLAPLPDLAQLFIQLHLVEMRIVPRNNPRLRSARVVGLWQCQLQLHLWSCWGWQWKLQLISRLWSSGDVRWWWKLLWLPCWRT